MIFKEPRTRHVVDLLVHYNPDAALLLVLVLRDVLGGVRGRHSEKCVFSRAASSFFSLFFFAGYVCTCIKGK